MRRGRWWLVGLAAAVLMVVLLAPLASPDPDGLERVARDQGFLGQATGAGFQILPGYTIPGIGDATLATVMAGLVGVGIVFVLAWGLGVLLRRRRGTTDRGGS